MSVTAFAANLTKMAASLRDPMRAMEEAGGIIAQEIKDNIDKGQAAGSIKVDDAGNIPGEPFVPLAAYTRRKREAAGIHHDHPLKATGSMYNSIGVKKNRRSVRIGAQGRKNRRKLEAQLGTGLTGIESSDLGREIPPRNPVGYTVSTKVRVIDVFMKAFGVRGSSYAIVDIGI